MYFRDSGIHGSKLDKRPSDNPDAGNSSFSLNGVFRISGRVHDTYSTTRDKTCAKPNKMKIEPLRVRYNVGTPAP